MALVRLIVDTQTHSISRDAFVDSDLVQLGAQVEGEVVELFVMEQERVRAGQLVARIDPEPYARRRDVLLARVSTAESALKQSEADLELLRATVPRRVSIAALEVHRTRDDARAAAQSVEVGKADLLMADEDAARYSALAETGASTIRRMEEALRAKRASAATVEERDNLHQASEAAHRAAGKRLELAQLGDVEILALTELVEKRRREVATARHELDVAELELAYTEVVAPFDAVVAKKWRYPGDYAERGAPIVTLYHPDLLFVTVQLPETLLAGVRPGNAAELDVMAFDEPFHGRVLWIGSTTGAEFSLIPRDVAAGEFTYVVQRVPVRISIDRDERWSELKPGLSVRARIDHGPGDSAWAEEAWKAQASVEKLMHRASDPSRTLPVRPGNVPPLNEPP